MDDDARRLLRLLSVPYDVDQLTWLSGRTSAADAVERRLRALADEGLIEPHGAKWRRTTAGDAAAAALAAERRSAVVAEARRPTSVRDGLKVPWTMWLALGLTVPIALFFLGLSAWIDGGWGLLSAASVFGPFLLVLVVLAVPSPPVHAVAVALLAAMAVALLAIGVWPYALWLALVVSALTSARSRAFIASGR